MTTSVHLPEQAEGEMVQLSKDMFSGAVLMGQKSIMKPSGTLLKPPGSPVQFMTGRSQTLMMSVQKAFIWYRLRFGDDDYKEEEFAFIAGLLWGYHHDEDVVVGMFSQEDLASYVGLDREIIRDCADAVKELTNEKLPAALEDVEFPYGSTCWLTGCYVGNHFAEVERMFGEDSD